MIVTLVIPNIYYIETKPEPHDVGHRWLSLPVEVTSSLTEVLPDKVEVPKIVFVDGGGVPLDFYVWFIGRSMKPFTDNKEKRWYRTSLNYDDFEDSRQFE